MFEEMPQLLSAAESTGMIALVVGGVLLCLAALTLWWKRRRGVVAAGSRMARRMGLTRKQRRLITTWAHAAGGLDVAAILISEGCFDHVSEVYGGHDDPIEVMELRTRLFAVS